MMKNDGFDTIRHDVDLCVVGGGLAGLCAAVSAARHGARVAADAGAPHAGRQCLQRGTHVGMRRARPGNNRWRPAWSRSLIMENLYRNPDKNYSIWDGILYEMAR